MIELLDDDDSEYDDIKQALLGRQVMTFASAAEAFFSADNKELLKETLQHSGDKMIRWLEKMTEGAETDRVKFERITMRALRSYMVPELKNYMDLSKPASRPEFEALAEQWVKSQTYKRSMFKQSGNNYKQYNQASEGSRGTYNSGSAQGVGYRKPISCFNC